MRDAKLWDEERLRELDVSMYAFETCCRRSLLKYFISSLPDSHYDDDKSFQDLKSQFIGNIEIADITKSITLYLKKVRGMEQRLQRLLAHKVP
jgi:hypothetical protein